MKVEYFFSVEKWKCILIIIDGFLLYFLTDDDEDEDDVIQMPLRSYVESNEEMTESDCNVQEDDERTGINISSVVDHISVLKKT